MATLAEVCRVQKLPKPFTLVNNINQWAPMWSWKLGPTHEGTFGIVAQYVGGQNRLDWQGSGRLRLSQHIDIAGAADREPPEGENREKWSAACKMNTPRRNSVGQLPADGPAKGPKLGRSSKGPCQLCLARQLTELDM